MREEYARFWGTVNETVKEKQVAGKRTLAFLFPAVLRAFSRLAYSREKSHTPLMFCAGGVGGVAQGLPVKSKNSVMSGMAASRAVSVGRLQRASMNRR